MREGKNREIKNVLGALGLSVNRLIRVSYGPFHLSDLEEGAVQELKGRMLRDQLGERLIMQANADFDAPILKPFQILQLLRKSKDRRMFLLPMMVGFSQVKERYGVAREVVLLSMVAHG